MGRAAPASSYFLCSEYGICATDALYLSVAISSKAILVSMDGEDFIDKLRKNHHNIETYHVSAFPVGVPDAYWHLKRTHIWKIRESCRSRLPVFFIR